jgi:hypothetical protein
LVSLAHKAAANVIRANRISIMDTPLVPPMVPASAVAMNVLKWLCLEGFIHEIRRRVLLP